MKITDQGLDSICSLGLLKLTGTVGLYHLYSWKSVDYFGGAPQLKSAFEELEKTSNTAVFIELSETQLSKLPSASEPSLSKPKESANLPLLDQFYETSIHFTYNEVENTLEVSKYKSTKKKLGSLKISLQGHSPFKIAEDTQKEFHGLFSPIGFCTEELKGAGFNVEKLWISLKPLFDKNNKFLGLIAGFNENQSLGLEALELFKTYVDEHQESLLKSA